MQTFVPATSFADTAKILDNKRLHKQALEGWQILMNLLKVDPAGNYRDSKGWSNHPAVKMWRGAELQLAEYILAMTTEWTARGFRTTIPEKAMQTLRDTELPIGADSPFWMREELLFEQIASTHRQALLVKDYDWYSQFGWDEDHGVAPDGYEYIWPVEVNK